MYTELFGRRRAARADQPGGRAGVGCRYRSRPPGKKVKPHAFMSSGEGGAPCRPSRSPAGALVGPPAQPDRHPGRARHAPPDDSNVEKVAARLLEFSTLPQFLHHAQPQDDGIVPSKLFGVTEEEPGVSRSGNATPEWGAGRRGGTCAGQATQEEVTA